MFQHRAFSPQPGSEHASYALAPLRHQNASQRPRSPSYQDSDEGASGGTLTVVIQDERGRHRWRRNNSPAHKQVLDAVHLANLRTLSSSPQSGVRPLCGRQVFLTRQQTCRFHPNRAHRAPQRPLAARSTARLNWTASSTFGSLLSVFIYVFHFVWISKVWNVRHKHYVQKYQQYQKQLKLLFVLCGPGLQILMQEPSDGHVYR